MFFMRLIDIITKSVKNIFNHKLTDFSMKSKDKFYDTVGTQ